jgi:hypothetical protein
MSCHHDHWQRLGKADQDEVLSLQLMSRIKCDSAGSVWGPNNSMGTRTIGKQKYAIIGKNVHQNATKKREAPVRVKINQQEQEKLASKNKQSLANISKTT